MNPPWQKDPIGWKQLPLSDRLEDLRKHYCRGPGGQSSGVQVPQGLLNAAILETKELIKEHEIVSQYAAFCASCARSGEQPQTLEEFKAFLQLQRHTTEPRNPPKDPPNEGIGSLVTIY